ncbi:hypothetical protein MSAN_02256000 [Mycena sanguinolenta]|uniref:Uncharacterized protein n=1 Tax=Mycena sanguinolenta TaxID=230812 RepID=A0A8H6X9U6_9AGAR|nr:hypothetical protein MSAN_02256000 [Mycena sanguinolenta]
MEKAFEQVGKHERSQFKTRYLALEQALARSHEANRDAQEKVSLLTASNARIHADHEDLKLTCAGLISLLEGLEAAGLPVDVDDTDAFARLNEKYQRLKGKYKKVRAAQKLQDV